MPHTINSISERNTERENESSTQYSEMVRKNGMQCPWHYSQVLLFMLIGLNIAIFYGVCFLTMNVSLGI